MVENTAGAEGATTEEAPVPQALVQEPPGDSEGATTGKLPAMIELGRAIQEKPTKAAEERAYQT